MGKRGTIRALTAMTNPACHCYGKETSLSLSVSVSLPSPVVALITGNRRNSPKSDRRGTRATFPLLFGSVIFEIIPTIHLPPLLSSLSLFLFPLLFSYSSSFSDTPPTPPRRSLATDRLNLNRICLGFD